MANFQLNELIRPYQTNDTVRLADGAGAANQLTDADVNKFAKLKGESQYGLCALGDEIEAFVTTASDAHAALYDGFLLGTVQKDGRKLATLDGLQATPGVGAVAVGDYVVVGTVTARISARRSPPEMRRKQSMPALGEARMNCPTTHSVIAGETAGWPPVKAMTPLAKNAARSCFRAAIRGRKLLSLRGGTGLTITRREMRVLPWRCRYRTASPLPIE